MTYHGRVKNGVIVLDKPAPLAEGTKVKIERVQLAASRWIPWALYSASVVVCAAVGWVLYVVPRPWEAIGSLLAGCLASAFAGHLICAPTWRVMVKRAGLEDQSKNEPPTNDLVGLFERPLLALACAVGYGHLAIAGWVALKAVFPWEKWRDRDPEKHPSAKEGEGRARFNLFLVGTGLSMASAVGGAVLALWLYEPWLLPKILTFGLPQSTGGDPTSRPVP